ncbi:hypothetical protein ETB97_005566 [Aspergillus alliaceus]|uniref:Uncharacterized protein n=1 Tax=Petromyces alliaceus TaxID=209559 RepID=A0A5N7C7X5_PETAA|nr:uncharacterized protein BDW43DRAFT_97004 [Aspergillus alliaceus]KAB8232872.1 hypothetical protein BDW43DRAFT_97004 [Aspergillus alliaceus]KAE8390240.1 hypothetical protein BDV23DRAFT_88361 [Aspergillus alliaceus]KAF5865001.1 hypothetical protein ETB97_005566 [Aspergillus burnettii]
MANSQEPLDAPDGSALTWIFDHCLRYPGSYELPLRTMYALNCNPTRQPAPANRPPETAFCERPSHSPQSSVSSQDAPLDRAADFRALLTRQISRLPSQPCSLPPSFVTSFLRRCFTPELGDVDFPQALTGLDYLKDLDVRRKKEVKAALDRLQVKPDDLKEKEELGRKWPNVLTWIESNCAKNRKAEALYTQVYIGLRRWTLINEMLLEPHNKANCIAMLNTLFPPVTDATVNPTPQLTPQILKSQRDGFFRYIAAFETNGRDILDKVIAQGAPEGEETGWPLVRDVLDKYLRITNEIIDDCAMVNDQSSLEVKVEEEPQSRRKVDSGISFGSADKFHTPSVHSGNSSEDIIDKPLPPAPKDSHPKSGGSTLERLARELRKLSDAGKVKSLKKMRSSSALTARSENIPSHTPDSSFFEIDEMKRKRLIWEATSRKRSHSKLLSNGSH